MVNLRQISEACGLSINAVSEILNRGKAERYRPETVERVRSAAERLKYIPHRVAQSMRSHRSRVVGFVTENASQVRDSLYHPSLYSFIVGLSHALIDAGRHLAVLDVFELDSDHADARSRLLDEVFFDGMVVHQGRLSDPRGLERRLGVPVVWYDMQSGGPLRHVRRDEERVGRELAAALLALGHRRIGNVLPGHVASAAPAFDGYHYSVGDRLRGFAAGLRAGGVEPVVTIPSCAPAVIAEAVIRHDLTAITTQGTNEFLALVQAACLVGRQIPGSLSLAAFDVDDRRGYDGVVPGGMRYDRYAAGQRSGAMLNSLLDDPLSPAETVLVGGDFAVGTTVAHAKT